MVKSQVTPEAHASEATAGTIYALMQELSTSSAFARGVKICKVKIQEICGIKRKASHILRDVQAHLSEFFTGNGKQFSQYNMDVHKDKNGLEIHLSTKGSISGIYQKRVRLHPADFVNIEQSETILRLLSSTLTPEVNSKQDIRSLKTEDDTIHNALMASKKENREVPTKVTDLSKPSIPLVCEGTIYHSM